MFFLKNKRWFPPKSFADSVDGGGDPLPTTSKKRLWLLFFARSGGGGKSPEFFEKIMTDIEISRENIQRHSFFLPNA